MPPKAKFSKDEVISAAVNIIEDKGIMFLTARSLDLSLQHLKIWKTYLTV